MRTAWVALLLVVMTLAGGAVGGPVEAQQGPTVRMVYFYANDCGHCQEIIEDLLQPLQTEYGERMEIKMIEISEVENYELMIQAEETFDVPREERGLPTLIIDGQVLIGEDEIRDQLPCLLDTCLEAGGTSWPDIPGLAEVTTESRLDFGSDFGFDEETEPCGPEAEAACEGPAPIWVAYFYQVGCQTCSRAEYDIQYAKSKYPQMVVKEFDVQENAALAEWLGKRAGVPEERRLATPSLFVGEDYLIGEEITLESLLDLAEKYAPTGADKVWADVDAQEARQGIVERFRSFGPLTVVFAGLVDGLNPCAFATLVFFVSYLTLSNRQGREVLAVGAAFTVGVFLAYLVVGLGFYKVLGTLGDLLRPGRSQFQGLSESAARGDRRHEPQSSPRDAEAHQRGDSQGTQRGVLRRRCVCHRSGRLVPGACVHGAGLPSHHHLRHQRSRAPGACRSLFGALQSALRPSVDRGVHHGLLRHHVQGADALPEAERGHG
jgi:thiol-disulfide isomerase/thioredoxin